MHEHALLSRNWPNQQAGQRLAELRQHAGRSQAELIAATGIAVVRAYELGRIAIMAAHLAPLAAALYCEPHDLQLPPGAPLPKLRFRRGRWLPMSHSNLSVILQILDHARNNSDV